MKKKRGTSTPNVEKLLGFLDARPFGSKDPLLLFDAHDLGITEVLNLKSSRLPEQLQVPLNILEDHRFSITFLDRFGVASGRNGHEKQ